MTVRKNAYDVGDIIKIKSDVDYVFNGRIGIVVEIEYSIVKDDIPGYNIIIAGYPGEMFWFLEPEITLLK